MRTPYAPGVRALCANLMHPDFLLRLLLHENLSKPYAVFHVTKALFRKSSKPYAETSSGIFVDRIFIRYDIVPRYLGT